jgi:hypothetical protein
MIKYLSASVFDLDEMPTGVVLTDQIKLVLRSVTRGRRATNVIAFDETTKRGKGNKERVRGSERRTKYMRDICASRHRYQASNITTCESSHVAG